MNNSTIFWRRIDVEDLERLELVVEPHCVAATSTVLCLEAGGFRLDHHGLGRSSHSITGSQQGSDD